MTGADLSYAGAVSTRRALHRAAVRLFGSWSAALEAAGVPPDSVRRRRHWSRETILDRIVQLAAMGADLSWTAVSSGPDRAMASAAVKRCHFGSWKAALEAAGISSGSGVSRQKRWTEEDILEAVRARRTESLPLNAKAVERDAPALFAAARRRFGSWSGTLIAAGVDPSTIALRRARSGTVRPDVMAHGGTPPPNRQIIGDDMLEYEP